MACETNHLHSQRILEAYREMLREEAIRRAQQSGSWCRPEPLSTPVSSLQIHEDLAVWEGGRQAVAQ